MELLKTINPGGGQVKEPITYGWLPGARIPGDPQAVGEALEKIQRKYGAIKPPLVVAAAAKPSSVLHRCFEWDDGVAGQRYREWQARNVVRSVVIMPNPEMANAEPVRAFVHIVAGVLEEPEYLSIAVVMEDEALRAQLLARALAEARAWQKRYRQLEQLAEVFAAIDELALMEEAAV